MSQNRLISKTSSQLRFSSPEELGLYSSLTIGQVEQFYLELCKRYRSEIDGSVIIAFHTQSTHFRPSKVYTEENWLPLAHVLMVCHEGYNADVSFPPSKPDINVKTMDDFYSLLKEYSARETLFSRTPLFNRPIYYITSLDFSNCKLGSNGAILLSKILMENTSLLRLDISNNSIGPRGCTALAESISKNSTLLYLNLHGNRFYYKGALSLASSIDQLTHSLIFIDLSNNHMGFDGVWAITLATQRLNTKRKNLLNEKNDQEILTKSITQTPTSSTPPSTQVSESTEPKSKNKKKKELKSTNNTSNESTDGPVKQATNSVVKFTEKISSELKNAVASPETLISFASALNLLSSKTYSARDLVIKSNDLRKGTSHFQKENLEINLAQNQVLEEIWNSISHGFGLLLSLIGTLILLNRASHQTVFHILGAWIFSLSLICMYTFSTLYHAFFKLSTTRHIFRCLDRSAIYLLIAGTYTPMCLVTFHGTLGWTILSVVWSIAFFGIIVDVLCLDKPAFSLFLYLLMGWLCVFFAEPLFNELPLGWQGTSFLVAGGLSYMSGVVFFVLDGRIHYAHTIWHVFVIIGSTLHWIMVFGYVMTSPIIHYPLVNDGESTSLIQN